MPIEVLTKEEIEKIVEEKLKKLLLETEISKKIAQLESTAAKLKDDIVKLSVNELAVTQAGPVAIALTNDLAELADLLQIRAASDSVTLRPKRYLATQDFRAVSEIVRRHGGFWSSERRVFIVRKTR